MQSLTTQAQPQPPTAGVDNSENIRIEVTVERSSGAAVGCSAWLGVLVDAIKELPTMARVNGTTVGILIPESGKYELTITPKEPVLLNGNIKLKSIRSV